MVLISVVSYVTGMALEGKQWPQVLYYVIFPIVILFAISKFKSRNANILSLSQALKVGVLVAVISGIVVVIYNLIFMYIIDPEFMGQVMEVAKDKMMEDNPDMTQEQMEQASKFMNMFQGPFITSAFFLAMSAFFGLIYSLIGGLVMKKENTHG